MILRSLESSSRGMQALIEMNDNTANNLANVNTVGFKKASLTFKNVYDANVVNREGTALNSSVRKLGELSMGSEVQKLTYDFSQGAMNRTDNPFDLAIEGDGFFKVQDVNGNNSYTRNGSFTMNNNSYLVTKEGDYVLDVEDRRIRINTEGMSMHSRNDIIVNENGQIQINNEKNQIQLQSIKICDFTNKEDMFCVGNSKFTPRVPANSPEIPAEKFVVVQGTLEMSNSNVVNEMINTINTSRNYESLSKLVKSDGDCLSRAMQVGRIRTL